MKIQTTVLLAAIAIMPFSTGVMADPLPGGVNPRTLPRSPGEPRSVLVPPPATGPCLAELSVDRIEISRSADGMSYDMDVTIRNSGTEMATGVDGGRRGYLGVKIDMLMERTVGGATNSARFADIDVIRPGTSQTFSGSVPFSRYYRSITARLDRGPDAPRCAYDARRGNDGLGVSGPEVLAAHAAGRPSYVRVAPWAM